MEVLEEENTRHNIIEGRLRAERGLALQQQTPNGTYSSYKQARGNHRPGSVEVRGLLAQRKTNMSGFRSYLHTYMGQNEKNHLEESADVEAESELSGRLVR